jgi:hypothetical protein
MVHHPWEGLRDVAAPDLDNAALKHVLKEALTETLHEQRELLHEVFAEALEEFALAKAVVEGQQTKLATRGEILRALQPKT